MDERSLVSVQEAAGRLGISPEGVRQHAAAGRLGAVKRGRQWWLDAREVERMDRQRPRGGRALSLDMAWALLLMSSGDFAAAEQAAKHRRYVSRAQDWLASHSLADEAPRLRARARLERFDAHPSELPRLLQRSDVLATGISCGDLVGLVGGERAAEVYAPAGRRGTIVDEHGLEPGDGPVCIRWVPDELWPLLDRDRDGRAPRAAVLLDLLENDDPRARREAARALNS